MKNKQKLWRRMSRSVKQGMVKQGKHELGGRYGRQVKQTNFLLSVRKTENPLLTKMMERVGLNTGE